MLHDLLVIVLVLAVEYIPLKTWSVVAPASFTAFLAKVFPVKP